MVHSTRFQELTSDSTNVLAAVAAKRRRTELGSGANRVVRLCSSHRHTRAQAFENPMFSAHFRVFALISAGRDTGNFSFELAELEEHLSFYTRFFRAFKQTESKGLHVTFSSSGGQAERKCMEFADRYLDAEDGITWSVSPDNLQEGGYYWPVRFQLRAVENNTIDIVDGGLVDWTQQFLSDRKERLLISGIGTEVFVKKFLL